MPRSMKAKFARHVILRVKPEKMLQFRRAYKKIMKRQLKEPGLRRLYLLEAKDESGKVISLTLWNSEEDARGYAERGGFKRNLDDVVDMLRAEPEVTGVKVLEHAVSAKLVF